MRHLKLLYQYIILLFALICLPVAASNPPLRIVTEELPPYNFLTTSGTLTGASVEVVQFLLRKLKVTTPIEVLPWARAYHLASTTPNVLIFSMLRTASREDKFHWLGHISPVDMQIFAFADAGIDSLDHLRGLSGQTIGIVRKSSQYEFIKSHPNISDDCLIIAGSYEQLYKMHQLGRVDLFMAPRLLVEYHNHAQQTSPQRQPVTVYRIPFVHQRKLYLVFSKTTPAKTVSRFKTALQQMISKGEVAKIFDNFQSPWQLAKHRKNLE